MIIRKPYAFLIKNFRKIHIFLFVLCGYVYYKSIQTRSFISEFLQLGTYDSYYEPVTKYASLLAILFMIVIIGLSLLLVIVLRHKKKPWKLYLLPVLSYSFLLVIFVLAISFFNSYESGMGTTTIRAINDLVFMATIPQYLIFIILLIRIFGVDLNKFDFKSDQEYLELSSDDREEVEINIDIDKESFKRTFKRLKRNIGYFYLEHKFIIHVFVVILVFTSIFSIYRYVFIVHKSYTQGDNVQSSGYSIDIHHSYFTDKDYHGKIISKDSNFVVLDLTITNNSVERTVNFNRFHVMNGTKNYSQTYRTYGVEFQDLGQTYDKLVLKNGQSKRLLLVYKVAKDLDPSKFVLYYQELDNNKPYLRKIKLNMEDLSVIKKEKVKVLREEVTINMGDDKKSFSIDDYALLNQATYNTRVCSGDYNCYSKQNILPAQEGKLFLQILVVSDTFDGKDFVDFSMEYGKIVYIDSKGKKQELSMVDGIKKSYDGNIVYFEVPNTLQEASVIRLVYTVRNKEYTYRLK